MYLRGRIIRMAYDRPDLRSVLLPLLKQGREFPSEEALRKYLKEHPKADPKKHTVREKSRKEKGEKEKSPVEEPDFLSENEDREASEEDKKAWLESVARNKLADKYHLDIIAGADGKVTVNDLLRAQHVAEAAVANIEKDASKPEGDLCQIRPTLCRGNLGIDRSSMPQLMEKPIGQMLQSDSASERKKAKAFIAAARAQGLSESKIQKLIKSNKSPKDQFVDDIIEEAGVVDEEVPVRDLKATQRNIKANKSYGMAQSYFLAEDSPFAQTDPKTGKKKAWSPFEAEILISSDGYILDGHHRWAAGVIADPDKKMKVRRINMTMDEILNRAFEQPGTFRADINDNIIPPDEPLDLAREPGSVWQQPGSDGWYGKNKKGKSSGPFKSKESAEDFAQGKKAASLQMKLVRLAYERPDLRGRLLPLIGK